VGVKKKKEKKKQKRPVAAREEKERKKGKSGGDRARGKNQKLVEKSKAPVGNGGKKETAEVPRVDSKGEGVGSEWWGSLEKNKKRPRNAAEGAKRESRPPLADGSWRGRKKGKTSEQHGEKLYIGWEGGQGKHGAIFSRKGERKRGQGFGRQDNPLQGIITRLGEKEDRGDRVPHQGEPTANQMIKQTKREWLIYYYTDTMRTSCVG